MQKIIIATTNQGKVKEISELIGSEKIELVMLSTIAPGWEIEETGLTFEENSFIKAKAVFERFEIPVIADDSGLCVDCLGGKPGVYSARYAGYGASAAERNIKLLNAVAKFDPPYYARFICSTTFISNDGIKVFEGILEGMITREQAGTNGFGYDPIFIPEGFTTTLASLSAIEKNRVSHRGRALRKLQEYLIELSLI